MTITALVLASIALIVSVASMVRTEISVKSLAETIRRTDPAWPTNSLGAAVESLEEKRADLYPGILQLLVEQFEAEKTGQAGVLAAIAGLETDSSVQFEIWDKLPSQGGTLKERYRLRLCEPDTYRIDCRKLRYYFNPEDWHDNGTSYTREELVSAVTRLITGNFARVLS